LIDYAKAYTELHERKADMFAGRSIVPHVDAIAQLVEKTGAQTLLDFGSGKGHQYSEDNVHLRWGGIMPTLYDPGIPELAKCPKRRFDGVICTDVMEHIAPDDVKLVLLDVFRHSRLFVFFSIACRPAKKFFPDGTNVHLTVKGHNWWERKINNAAKGRRYQIAFVD